MHTTQPPQHRLAFILLIIILAIAAGLRFYNINWDNGLFAHPDERSTVAFYAPTIQWPTNPADLLDPRTSTLNPFWDVPNQTRRSYTYGHFPLYTLVFIANLLNNLTPLAADLNLPLSWSQFLGQSLSGHGFAWIGRALMALADLGTVYLLYLIGRRLYGLWGGVLAAALSAFTVLQIQLAHFFAVDTVSTTFTILAIYGAMLLYDRQSRPAAIITGLGIALAVASKFSALPIIFAPIVAGFLATLHWRTTIPTRYLQTTVDRPPSLPTKSAVQNRMIGLVLFSLLLAFLLFALTSPFVLLDFENFKQAVLDEQGDMVSGVADLPFTRQYRHTTAYWYFIKQQLQWGMGWPLGLLALAGTVWVISKALRGKAQPGEWVALTWIVLYFGPTGLFLAKFMRYMLPVVPLFTLFGAGLVIALWHFSPTKRKQASTPSAWAYSEMADYEAHFTASQSSNPPSLQPAPPSTRFASGHGFDTTSLCSVYSGCVLSVSKGCYLQKLTKSLTLTLTTLALGGAIIWSLAFVNGVYGPDHPWLTFARWVYANVPDGSCIAWEHWDDRMPSDIPEPDGNPGAHGYYQPQLPLYDNDSQQKYELIRNTLMECDYVVLATNRLWRTIPRLPQRYPLSTRYYEALFSGELGFEQIYTAETPPHLGPLVFDDQPADESFTVYDHPKPILFHKTRQLSAAEWDAILGNTWQQAIPNDIGQPTLLMLLRGANSSPAPPPDERETQKSLLLATPVDQLPAVNDFRWNTLANRSTMVATLVWWLVVVGLGLLTFPLTFLLFYKLPDWGYALSKSLGLLLISYFVWINSSLGLLGNTFATALLALLLLGGLSLWTALQHRQTLTHFWRQHRLPIITAEIIFSLVYLFFIYLRVLNPDLWQPWLGGEKMLEIGFLNAIVKSVNMPPYDPFFAGGIINYYYYGLFLANVLIKLTGIQPAIAFNLAVPTLAALTATNVFSLAGNLALTRFPFGHQPPSTQPVTNPTPTRWGSQSVAAGLLGVLFVVFIGNLEGAAQFMRNLGQLSLSDFSSAIPGLKTFVLALSGLLHLTTTPDPLLPTYNYWDPTRVIPETINEFPYFSFLFADLHPHMIGIPFTVLFLSLAYNWLRPNDQLAAEQPPPAASLSRSKFWSDKAVLCRPKYNFGTPKMRKLDLLSLLSLTPTPILRWLALPFVLGAIAVINTWDLPTYLGLMVATFLLSQYRQAAGHFNLGQGILLLLRGGFFAAGLAAVTYLLYAPFFLNYQAPAETGLGLVRNQTPLDQHLKIWGFFLFVIIFWLGLSLLHPASRHSLLRVASLALRRWNVWPHFSRIYQKLIHPSSNYQLAWWSLGLAGLITGFLLLLGYTVPAYLLPLTLLALLLLFRREVRVETAYVGLLTFTGLLILVGVEFFFLNDFLGGGEYYRMNTLFKFFIQVWVMFGVMSAVALGQLWHWIQRWSFLRQMAWQITATLLLLATFIYPIFATQTRLDDRFPGDHNRPTTNTLDGLAYMTIGIFEWPAGNPIELKYDYKAIRWLQDNVSGTPIIAEAKIGYYREGGMRVAAYTGLPSILGGLHQNEQHPPWQIGDRDLVVNEFWSTPDPTRTLELIDTLNLSYIYIGQVERITYGPQIDDKFEQLHQQGALEVVFENEKTKIYKRKSDPN